MADDTETAAMRSTFEAWVMESCHSILMNHVDGRYCDTKTQLCWDAWQAAAADFRETLQEMQKLQKLNTAIISGLSWTGDGYEWTGAEYDYRIKPSEAAGLMLADRQRWKDENAKLRDELTEATRLYANAIKDAENVRNCVADLRSALAAESAVIKRIRAALGVSGDRPLPSQVLDLKQGVENGSDHPEADSEY